MLLYELMVLFYLVKDSNTSFFSLFHFGIMVDECVLHVYTLINLNFNEEEEKKGAI